MLQERIDALRQASRALEPDSEQRHAWTQEITTHAEIFLQKLTNSRPFSQSSDEGKGVLASHPTEDPESLENLLKTISEHVTAPGIRLGAPGCLAFIPISTLYPAALGDFLAASTNPYAGNFFASPGAVRMEHLLTRWMAGLVGYPSGFAGDLTSGGSIANLSAIVAAREARGIKPRDFEQTVVYLTAQTHHSIGKALRIAGLGSCTQRLVEIDAGHRMRPEALERAIQRDRADGLHPWLIVAAAGSTDVGAVDPLPQIGQTARRHGLWLHVDAAYGGFFALCEPGRKVLAGIEQSDSIILDPHKGLFMPCGTGAVLLRDGKHLLNAYRYEASYMQDRAELASLEEISPSELSPELTRPFRGLRLWLSLKLMGLRAFRAALEEKLLLARYFYERVQHLPGIEVGPPPDLSVVPFRWVPKTGNPDDYNQRVLHAIQHDGRIFITSTRLNDEFWLRLAILCATTHREHIDLALRVLKECSAKPRRG